MRQGVYVYQHDSLAEYTIDNGWLPEAPIFTAADYGIGGGLFKAVPILTEEIQKIRNENLT